MINFKRTIRLWVFLFSIFSGYANQVYSQAYSAYSISLAEGLSQSSVYGLTQDSLGFIWAGTQDGLNRYDGLHFKTYYNQPFDSLSLPSSNIMSLLSDSKGRLWVGTSGGGLAMKENGSDNFKTWKSPLKRTKGSLSSNWINVIYEDASGRIWIGTSSGLDVISHDQISAAKGSLSFTNLIFDTSGVSFNMISAIYYSSQGELWVGTKAGLHRIIVNDKNPSASKIQDFGITEGLKSDEIRTICEDRSGHLWVGTSIGLSLFDEQKNRFDSYCLEEGNSKCTSIYALANTVEGRLWIGTNSGLYYIDKADLDLPNQSNFRFIPFQTNGVKLRGGVLNISEDKISKGIIWIGSDADGIIKLVPVIKNFQTNHLQDVVPVAFVFSLLKDSKNYLWIGTSTGLIRHDKTTNKYSVFTSGKNGLASDYIQSIKEGSDGAIWIATMRGLQRIEKPYSMNPEFHSIILNQAAPQAQARKIYISADSSIWVVLPRKIYKLKADGSDSKLIIDNQLCDLIPENAYNTAFVFDSNDNIWLSTSGGLFVFERPGNSGYDFRNPLAYFHNHTDTTGLRNDVINDLFEDSNGNIWICSANGLTKGVLKNHRVSFKNYSTANGLINNAVYGVLEDTINRSLWISTNGGLSKFDLTKESFRNFTLHDGLQSNEFDAGAFFQSDDHEFYFGGVNGYTSFYSNDIREDEVIPRVYISGYSMPSGESFDLLSSAKNKNVELDYNQNSFSISFTALQYAFPQSNRYAYMLEGFHKSWINSGSVNQVNFSQLPPGKYILRVKAANSDGIYNESGDFISIVIHPPFWQTLWFYLLIAIAICLVFYALHRYKLRMSTLQHAEIEKIRKETAADFHDELGHKLTTIGWFAEILKKRLSPEMKDERTYLDKIIETSANLYHTMKDLLWAMDPGKDSLNDLYIQMRHFGESLYDQTGVEFIATDSGDDWSEIHLPLTQKRHVLLIFKEAMHNSLKHSKSSKIELNAIRQNGHVSFILKDNGKGFKFDWDIAGNGLRNVRKRAEQIKGKIDIKSDSGGTKLELKVSLTKH